MSCIYELLALGRPINDSKAGTTILGTDRVGIEVEVEEASAEIVQKRYKYWNIVHDGSLRNNGVEFVLKGPQGGTDVENALDELFDNVKKKPVINARTGIHVHVDVRDMTPEQLKSFCLLAAMFEEVFMKKTGDRNNNIFCCKFSTSDNQLKFISSIDKWKSPYKFHEAFMAVGKYASVNFVCIQQLGSVEFRYHKGSFNKEEITQWVNTLLSLKSYAMRADVLPENLTNNYSALGGSPLFKEVVGEDLYKHYYTEDMDIMLQKGMRLAQDGLIYAKLVDDEQEVLESLAVTDYTHPMFERLKRPREEDPYENIPQPARKVKAEPRMERVNIGQGDEPEQVF